MLTRAVLPALLKTPPGAADVKLPPVPTWAAELLAALDTERAAAVREAGVTGGVEVVGDPAWLEAPNTVSDHDTLPEEVDIEAVMAALTGALEFSRRRQHRAVRRATDKALARTRKGTRRTPPKPMTQRVPRNAPPRRPAGSSGRCGAD